MTKKKILFVGRFQPLHRGHLKLYHIYKEMGFDVIFLPYLIENYNDENYPFTEDEIRSYFDEANVDYKIIKVRKSLLLFIHVLKKSVDYAKTIDGEIYFLVPESRKLFQTLLLVLLSNGSAKIHVGYKMDIYGTYVRKMYYSLKKDWIKYVPKSVRKVMIKNRKEIFGRVFGKKGIEIYDLKFPQLDFMSYFEKKLFYK